MRALLPTIASAALGVLVWAEVVHARSSTRGFGPAPDPVGREAIVVLGFADRGRHANAVNRYRVRAALRSVHPTATESVLVLCGGAVAGTRAEADLLAEHARTLGWAGPMLLDRESTSTWENVRYAIPLVEHADTIRIVSNSLHAEKARAYLRRQRPDLAARLAPAAEYRFGEIPLIKPVAAVVGLRKLRALRRTA